MPVLLHAACVKRYVPAQVDAMPIDLHKLKNVLASLFAGKKDSGFASGGGAVSTGRSELFNSCTLHPCTWHDASSVKHCLRHTSRQFDVFSDVAPGDTYLGTRHFSVQGLS